MCESRVSCLVCVCIAIQSTHFVGVQILKQHSLLIKVYKPKNGASNIYCVYGVECESYCLSNRLNGNRIVVSQISAALEPLEMLSIQWIHTHTYTHTQIYINSSFVCIDRQTLRKAFATHPNTHIYSASFHPRRIFIITNAFFCLSVVEKTIKQSHNTSQHIATHRNTCMHTYK